MNVKTKGDWTRGTVKAIREAGVDLNQPFIYGGTEITGPVTEGGYRGLLGKRFERVEIRRDGTHAYDANNDSTWLGGTASKFWVLPVVEAPAASEVDAAETDELEGLKFPQLMEIAKALKVPGRGVARKPQLIAGIRAARAA